MKTETFLDILEQRGLVTGSILQQLREKVAQSERRVTPKSLLKYLVKQEFITRSQAKQLLQTTLYVSPSAESSILGIMALPDISGKRSSRLKSAELDDKEEIPTLAPIDSPEESSISKQDRKAMEREDELASISGFVSEVLSKKENQLPKMSLAEFEKKEKEERTKGRRRQTVKQNEWDSPLLLLGGGGLVVLILAGVIIGYLLRRGEADVILAEAGEYYDGGSYTQAIKQYDRFVKDFPSHPEFSEAKVKLGMAKIWKATLGTKHFSGALETSQQVLDAIEDEPQFKSAQRDLASRLPAIAQGLAVQAEIATDAEDIVRFIAQSKAALALCNNTKFIPKSFRDDVVLNEVMESLDRVERTQKQNIQLAQAMIDIHSAIEANNTAKAYEIHKTLVTENPGLLKNQSLAEKIREISAAEQSVIKYVAIAEPAITSPRPNPLVAELALATRRGPEADATGIVAVRIDGAIYAVNARDGKLLWRRFVGLDSQVPPTILPSGDWLVVDARHNELLRLAGSSGELVWRQTFSAPILQPVQIDAQLLVADDSGILHVLDVRSGERTGYIQLSQPLSVPPTVGPHGRRIYAVGQHSSIFTLSVEDFSCMGVFFLGHSNHSVTVPLVCSLNKAIVAVNTGIATSRMHVLSTDDDGILVSSESKRRLEGLVNTSLLEAGRRLVALTSSGQMNVYEVGTGIGREALAKIAFRDAESGPPVARFGLLHDGHVWSAGNQLSKRTVSPTGNQLPVRDIDRDYGGDTFDHPLQMVDNTLIHVRRPAEQAGAIVAAMESASGKALWETELAVPLAGAPAVDLDGTRFSAITASGAAFLLDQQAISRSVQDESQQLSSFDFTMSPLTDSVGLGQGRLALGTPGSDQMLHFRPDAPQKPLTAIRLPAPLSCSPVAWRNGFVAPTRVGQVYLYDAETAEQLGSPFQPALRADSLYKWLTPAVYGKGENSRLLISDGVGKIYLLRYEEQPQPNLAVVAETRVGKSALATRLAIVGTSGFAGTRNGQLARFTLPELESLPAVDLSAHVVWGPFGTDEKLVLATDTDELVCVDTQGQIAWRRPLVHGPPHGKPLADANSWLIVWRSGGLSRIQIDDGSERGFLKFEQPAVAGPIAFGKRLLLTSSDGTLLVVDPPQN